MPEKSSRFTSGSFLPMTELSYNKLLLSHFINLIAWNMRILGAVYMTDYGKNQSFFVNSYQQHRHDKTP